MDKLLVLFKMLSWQYFLYVVLAIAIVVGLVWGLYRFEDKLRKIIQIALVSVMGLFAVLEYIFRIIGFKDFELGINLPLEIFEIFVYLNIFIIFTNRASWKKFAYLIMSPIALYQIIFTPSKYMQLNAGSMAIICFYMINALIIASAILNVMWDENDLEKKNILDASITFAIIISIVHVFNVILGFTAWGLEANYFGTMGGGYDVIVGAISSIIPIPFICIIPLLAILVGVEFLILLPFEMLKTNKRKQGEMEELIALGNLKKQAEYRDKERKKRARSQILIKGEKASPIGAKNTTNSAKSGFVQATKEVKTNKEIK